MKADIKTRVKDFIGVFPFKLQFEHFPIYSYVALTKVNHTVLIIQWNEVLYFLNYM